MSERATLVAEQRNRVAAAAHLLRYYKDERAGQDYRGSGELRVTEQHRRRGVATWLLGRATYWLRLAEVERLLDYAWLEGQDPTGQDYTGYRSFLAASGFLELTRTKRGWTRTVGLART